MKKNILFLIESLRDGGSEKSISNIATELSKNNNVILVVATNNNRDYTYNGKIIEIKEFINKNPLKRLIGIRKLKKIKKKNNINISISYLTAYNYYNVSSRYNDKVFISIRNHLSAKKESLLAKLSTIYSNKKADKIICCSKSVQTDQINNFKAKKEKTIVIENYIDSIHTSNEKKENIIITTGRLTKHKSQKHIIKAMSLVIKKIPDAKLLILGRGKEEKNLQELIKKYNLEKNIELLGFQNNIDKYLKQAKVFVLSSDYEGFSNALIEAMSYSIPVIAASSPGGNEELLTNDEYKKDLTKAVHTKYGILIPNFHNEHQSVEITKNERILATEIINLLTNKKDYNYYKKAATERAKKYTKEIILKKWNMLIEERKKKKKIMIYTMAMIKRGTERTIANLSNHFINEYEITIVTNINGPIEYKLDKRIKVIPIDKKDKRNEFILKKIITKTSKKRTNILKEIINEEKPDIIITTLPEPTIRILSIKKTIKNIPIIVSIRNHPKSEFKSIIGKIIRNKYYKKANHIVVQDSHYIKYIPNNNIKVIPNYLSDNFIEDNKPIKKDKKIISIASLVKQKNIPLLIEAFSNLKNEYYDYKLVIIGEGKEKNKIIKLIQKKNLSNRVILMDTKTDIKKELLSSTLFVLSSNYEGMPNSLLEAMSLSLPVITTYSTEAIDTIIVNNKNGIIIQKNNNKELTKKIEYLLSNKNIRDQLGKEASKIKDEYNKEIIIKEWEELIKEELNSIN